MPTLSLLVPYVMRCHHDNCQFWVNVITETKMSFWRDFRHWEHWKLLFWQLSVLPVTKISSKWHFSLSKWSCWYFKVCSRHPRRLGLEHPVLILDPHNKVLYCNIAKAASTVWKRAMAKITSNLTEFEFLQKSKRYIKVKRNPTHFIHDHRAEFGLQSTIRWTQDTWNSTGKEYYKFLFVRDPFDRLKSTYHDKFLIHDTRTDIYQSGILGQYIRDQFRTAKSNDSSKIRFEEFLRYILVRAKKGVNLDKHWARYVDRCNPCGIEYDFIGHTETMAEDAEYLFKEVFHSDLNTTKTLDPSYGPSASVHALDRSILSSYDEVPGFVIQGIRDYYAVDAEMFGYDRNRQLRTEVQKTKSW